MNKYILFLSCIFLISLVSANLIITPNILQVNKTYGENKLVNLQITNNDTFIYYNISFDSEIITVPQISLLNPNEVKTVEATIKGNTQFSDIIKLKGFYESNLGASEANETIYVDYGSGISKCDFTAVKGLSITWVNLVADEIKMKNENTQEYVTTILEGNNYTTNFNNPEVFRYAFYRRGYKFTDVCDITILNDVGLVNNPEKDGILTLELNITYNQTTIETNLLQNSYTLDFYETDEGVLTIKNTGAYTARNINLNGDWFDFNKNNFNLEPNTTSAVVYTIKQSKSGIINTNDTDKTYNKNISINGNFNHIDLNFTIFIKYLDITNMSDTTPRDSLISLLLAYCNDHPDESFCSTEKKVIYINGSGSKTISKDFTEEQVDEMMAAIFDDMDNNKELKDWMKEQEVLRQEQSANQTGYLAKITSYFEQDLQARQTSNDNQMFVLLLSGAVIICALLSCIIYLVYRNKKMEVYKKMT